MDLSSAGTECKCFQCFVLETPIIENKEIAKFPITAVRKKSTYKPLLQGTDLNLSNMQINSIWMNTISYMYLRTLLIKDNPLTYLPDIYTLCTLDCSNCNLKELPSYLPNLTDLKCSNNFIKSIPKYPTLLKLDASDNIITKIDRKNFPKLKSLVINNNPITKIYVPTLTYLEAYRCPLIILYNLPGLARRSSVMGTAGKFEWIAFRAEKITVDFVLIDWTTNKISTDLLKILSKKPMWRRVTELLFNLRR